MQVDRVQIHPTGLPGVLVIEPRVFTDDRGFFYEVFRAERFAAAGLPTSFAQDNHSRSTRGVLRGLHFQADRPQGKLITCVRGRILDVAVDIRVGSPTFGRWTGVELDEAKPVGLWIPPGFAHGFHVLSDVADVVYKCTETYAAELDRGILWSDPALGIDWGTTAPLLSPKDASLPSLAGIERELPRFG